MPRPLARGCLVALLTLPACVVEGDPGATEDGSSDGPGASSTGGPTGDDPTTGGVAPTVSDPTVDTDDPDPSAGPTSATSVPTTDEPDPGTTTDAEPGTSTGPTPETTTDPDPGTSTGDETTGGVVPDGPELPIPSKPCPELEDGMVEFHPDGLASPRDVRIWVDPAVAAEKDGPVVFYWHGTGGNPQEAQSGLGELGISEILDLGGVVVAPTHDPGAGIFPWHLVLSEKLDDLVLADEVLACAQEQFGVDATRIHSLGFSAGALHTAQMSIRRSSYMASVTLYSGGLIFGAMPTFEDPANKFPAMIFHGGPGDVVVVGFEQASKDYAAYLTANEHFSFLCNHGGGHSIPDQQDNVMLFFSDHTYGTDPSPYANALPDGFPDYCMLP